MFKKDYKSSMQEVKSAAKKNIRSAAEMYNAGQISQKEFQALKHRVLSLAAEQRKQIVEEREFDIDREEERLTQKIIGTDGDMKRYRELYKERQGFDKNGLIQDYQESVRLGDSEAQKASAAIAVAKNVSEITDHYKARNPEFAAGIEEFRGFMNKWRSVERKFQDYQVGDFAHVREPSKRIETYEAGKFINSQGYPQPYFRDRIVYDD